MVSIVPSNIPDAEYLTDMVKHMRHKFERHNGALEQLLVYTGALLNWVGDFMTDPNVSWTKEDVEVEKLYLTGMGPDENAFIIDQAKRSPRQLQVILHNNHEAQALFAKHTFDPLPILVRLDEDKIKVIDGMHRVIGAIKEDQITITAYFARQTGIPQPHCEPHVIYDLLRAYERGINKDTAGLITALRFLRQSYFNVEQLLRERFNEGWINNPETREIIRQVLND
ncbi:MAG: hypothetical protein WC734_04110 [Patescibacteria group bacterium]|jgi:hypothetical protein